MFCAVGVICGKVLEQFAVRAEALNCAVGFRGALGSPGRAWVSHGTDHRAHTEAVRVLEVGGPRGDPQQRFSQAKQS